jgi:DNA-binding NarL/FixJ family response regulator
MTGAGSGARSAEPVLPGRRPPRLTMRRVSTRAVLSVKKLRVFIVDDSPAILDGLSELLAGDGLCEVVGLASSEQRALEWSFQNDAGFDVAILDLLLHEGSGFEVLAHLSKYQPGKVVVLSEYVTPMLAERCKAAGAVAAFTKLQTPECLAFISAMARNAPG